MEMQHTVLYLIALGVLSFCAVVGNILVIFTFVKDSALRNSTGCVIMSLASCDLITGLIAVPTVIMSMLDHIPFFKQGIGCDFSGVMVFSCFNCSLLTLSLISLQRYFLITQPYNTLFSKHNILVMISGVWVYSFGASMVPLLPHFNGFVLYKWSLSCILDLRGMDGFRTKYYSAAYNTLTFLIAGISISFTQYYILREIYKRTKTKAGILGDQQSKERSQTKRFYATKMISWMVAGFLICTIPIMILLFLKVSENIPPKEYAAFAAFMTWLNSLVNPTIYWYFNKKYSKHLRDSMRRGSKLLKRMSDRALTTSKRPSSLLKILKGKSPAKKGDTDKAIQARVPCDIETTECT